MRLVALRVSRWDKNHGAGIPLTGSATPADRGGLVGSERPDLRQGLDKSGAGISLPRKGRMARPRLAPVSGTTWRRILVANCVGCHGPGRPGLTQGKLDMTSFATLMKGTPSEKVVEPGQPDESHLVLRVRGEETPRMPQGGNNSGLSEEAIDKISRWIKDGARLDAALDPKDAIESYAASPDQVPRNQLARMSPKDRDQKVENVGRDRWKLTDPKLKPEITSGEHFVLFSNLPRDRAANALKVLEKQLTQLKNLLGAPAIDWGEKVSIYVFNDRKDFIEFARTIESREVDASASSSGHLTGPQPYIAVVDPMSGKKDEPAALRRQAPRQAGRGETGGRRLRADARRSPGREPG